MNTRIAPFTATVLAGLLTTVTASAAEKIKLVERPTDETTIDLGAKGDSIGDLLVFANPVFDSANKTQVATDQGSCVRTLPGKSWECNWTIKLKAGQIMVDGSFLDEGDSVLAVIGGTGKYAGARGTMTLHPQASPSTALEFTYDLL